jgi:hypothetical protein
MTGWKEPCVDHDHSTGAVRGLLCGACNKAIGLLKDNPQLARSIASYLENTMSLKTDAEVKIDQMTLLEARNRKLIDRKALLAAIHAGKLPGSAADHLKYHTDAVTGKWAPIGYGAVDDMSVLCSITAACRGRLHATEKWVARCDETGGRDKVKRTPEDQLALIGQSWKLFLKADAAALLAAEESALAPPHLS